VPAFAQGPIDPSGLDDPTLETLNKARARWLLRPGPIRRVADVVVLVPDLPTFFQAVAEWDETRFFPVLIEDAESTPGFLRSFRPDRIVRWPPPPGASGLHGDALWREATQCVGRAWVPETATDSGPPGDRVPRFESGPTPPGIVLSEPESPQLAGAVALAAGRFQPMLRWTVPGTTEKILSAAQARVLADDLRRKAASLTGKVDSLGDNCDFLTLAGPWPYRYTSDDVLAPGLNCLDDTLGYTDETGHRWAYTGRLTGDMAQSVYQAMCGLFIQPSRATLFSTYGEGLPWAPYDPANAARQFENDLDVTLLDRTHAGRDGWLATLGGRIRSQLIVVNSSGGATSFHLTGALRGRTDDVPAADPSAVVFIHSGSAANPYNPSTIAGRWLANGAFAYYGSTYEPFVTAFRTPRLVLELLRRQVPLAAAVERYETEAFGQPWRLILVGDPLWRLTAIGPMRAERRVRVPSASVAPAHAIAVALVAADPPANASSAERFDAGRDRILLEAAAGDPDSTRLRSLANAILAIPRTSLDATRRQARDRLLFDCLSVLGDQERLQDVLESIPRSERTSRFPAWTSVAERLHDRP
jgi:hypothetical protein